MSVSGVTISEPGDQANVGGVNESFLGILAIFRHAVLRKNWKHALVGLTQSWACTMSCMLPAYPGIDMPEDVSPPPLVSVGKLRSFESLNAAQVLQSGLLAPQAPGTSDSVPPKSSGQNDDGAINCLMLLSANSSIGKRKADAALPPAPRRRLTMTSPPPEQSSCGDASLPLLSDANLTQLQFLAAAYKLCPAPSPQQLVALADRIGMPADRVQDWYDSRQARCHDGRTALYFFHPRHVLA